MRRAIAFLLALAFAGLPAVSAQAGTADLRARRGALLAHIADLTDRAEEDQAAVVLAQERRRRADADLARARNRLEQRAVDAYVHGLGRAVEDLARPNVYLEAAFAQDREAIRGLRTAKAAASQAATAADSVRDTSRAAAAELDRQRQELEATIARQDDLDAQVQAAAEVTRRASAQPFVDSFETDPVTIARHRAATQRQQALMARWPFGPVTGVPSGLKPTGEVLSGPASWYGPGFDGRSTASGAIYDQEGWTCASKELPLGTLLLVSENGRSVLLLVNDRGPYVDGWILDLSHAAAQALRHPGVGVVTAQVLVPE